jgi:hypothetical protein
LTKDELFQHHVKLVFDYDRIIRSHAIYESTAIEGTVESIIAWHFCPDEEKHLSFVALIFVTTELTFSKKIDILERLLKNSYPDILKDVPNIINELTSLRKFRNKFAHNELILDNDKVTADGLWLRSMNRDGKVIEEFISSKDADARIKSAQNLRWYIFYVMLEIQNRVTGKEHNQHEGFLDAIKSGVMAKLGEPKQEALVEPPAKALPRNDN